MIKDKLKQVGSILQKNSKIVIPIAIILVVAVIVSVTLFANDDRIQDGTLAAINTESTNTAQATPEPTKDPVEPEPENTVLTENEEIRPLMCTYYNAYAYGDIETIKSITNYLDETEALSIQAMSEYVESYPELTVYTKPGPVEGSYLAYVYYKMTVKNFEEQISGMETFYVCTKEDGTFYLNEGEVSDEELEYIREVNSQDDVVELYNRVTVECNETFLNNTDLFYYIQEVVSDVQKTTGETLAAQMSTQAKASETASESGTTQGSESEVTPQTSETDMTGQPLYAKATTTVNVRVSDSEQADKAGKVNGGTRVEVIEQLVNGWSKIKTNDLEGYIKSEYLQMITVPASGEAIGTITATSNVNVRDTASESGDRLGVLAGGESAELLGRENGWCKINYNGQVGYVKEDFVQ